MLRAAAIIAGLMLVAPLAAREPLPRVLDCPVSVNANWIAGHFPASYADDHRYIVSLDTRSGEWFLRNLDAAALTSGGGNFEIVHDGIDYPSYWLGLDDGGATQMRIDLYQPDLPFLFVGHDNALFTGRCIEPDEPFVFLR